MESSLERAKALEVLELAKQKELKKLKTHKWVELDKNTRVYRKL